MPKNQHSKLLGLSDMEVHTVLPIRSERERRFREIRMRLQEAGESSPARKRAWLVARAAIDALEDPEDERAAECVQRLYAALVQADRGKGNHDRWLALGDAIEDEAVEGADAEPRWIVRCVREYYPDATPKLEHIRQALGEYTLKKRRLTGTIAAILVDAGAEKGTGGAKATRKERIRMLTKAVSEAFRARREKR